MFLIIDTSLPQMNGNNVLFVVLLLLCFYAAVFYEKLSAFYLMGWSTLNIECWHTMVYSKV